MLPERRLPRSAVSDMAAMKKPRVSKETMKVARKKDAAAAGRPTTKKITNATRKRAGLPPRREQKMPSGFKYGGKTGP